MTFTEQVLVKCDSLKEKNIMYMYIFFLPGFFFLQRLSTKFSFKLVWNTNVKWCNN